MIESSSKDLAHPVRRLTEHFGSERRGRERRHWKGLSISAGQPPTQRNSHFSWIFNFDCTFKSHMKVPEGPQSVKSRSKSIDGLPGWSQRLKETSVCAGGCRLPGISASLQVLVHQADRQKTSRYEVTSCDPSGNHQETLFARQTQRMKDSCSNCLNFALQEKLNTGTKVKTCRRWL